VSEELDRERGCKGWRLAIAFPTGLISHIRASLQCFAVKQALPAEKRAWHRAVRSRAREASPSPSYTLAPCQCLLMGSEQQPFNELTEGIARY